MKNSNKTHKQANSGKSSKGKIIKTMFTFQGEQVELKVLVQKVDEINVKIGKSIKETYLHYIDLGEIMHSLRSKYKNDNKRYSEAKLQFDDGGTISRMPQQMANDALHVYLNREFIKSKMDEYIKGSVKELPYSLGYFWKNMKALIHEHNMENDAEYRAKEEAKISKLEANQEASESASQEKEANKEKLIKEAIAFHTRFLNLSKSKSDNNKIDFVKNELCTALDIDLLQLVEMLLPTINVSRKKPIEIVK